jgi:hypothetical protein
MAVGARTALMTVDALRRLVPSMRTGDLAAAVAASISTPQHSPAHVTAEGG